MVAREGPTRPRSHPRGAVDPLATALLVLRDHHRYTRILAPGPEPSAVQDSPVPRADYPLLGPPTTIAPPPEEQVDPRFVTRYLNHSCDLTLSGGVATATAGTSAVCALAEHYVLRRIGGSGAAALTAAAAAAAELGRTAAVPGEPNDNTGDSAGIRDQDLPVTVRPGFAGLADLLAWLVGEHRTSRSEPWLLARLLQPAAADADAHRLVTAVVRPRPGTSRGIRLAAAALATTAPGIRVGLGSVWLGTVLGGAGTLVAFARSWQFPGFALVPAAFVLALTFVLAAVLVTGLLVVPGLGRVLREVRDDDGWGLVAGVTETYPPTPEDAARAPGLLDRLAGVPAAGGMPPLVDWAAERLDDLAGIPASAPLPGPAGGLLAADPDGPSAGIGVGRDRYALTFGDLWLGASGARTPADLRRLHRAAGDPRLRSIDLTLRTTDLAAGRPLRLPFGATERPEDRAAAGFSFCRECLVRVLPARVVDQMVLMSPDGTPAVSCPRHDGLPLRPLPEPWDLPVVFAVRLAMATPGVLRAVPLYRGTTTGVGPVHQHWFTDGTVAAGLPAHEFDQPLARWPTFALTTRTWSETAEDTRTTPDEVPGVRVPDQDAADLTGAIRPVSGAAGLAGAVLAAAAGWREASRGDRPGWRGRLAQVRSATGRAPYLNSAELRGLAWRGYRAGGMLRDRFTGPDGASPNQTGTDRYRWIRLRMALREQRRLSLLIGAQVPLYSDLAGQYRVPEALAGWFAPPLTPGAADPAWGDAVAALTHLRSLASGGVLDWDTGWGAPPGDPEPGPVD